MSGHVAPTGALTTVPRIGGVLGTGSTTTGLEESLLVRVHAGAMVTVSNDLENITAIDAGWKHSLAIDVNNFVLAWGWNSYGQLGDGTPDERTTPIRVHDGNMVTDSNYLEHIIAVSAGRSGEYSLALDDSNQCWSWGLNDEGQLGDGTKTRRLTPVQVKGGQMQTTWLENIACISAGEEHSAAVDSDGAVFCWGDNEFLLGGSGKLGIGQGGGSTTPVHVLSGEQPGMGTYLEHIVAVSAGWDHTLALARRPKKC